MRTRATLVSEWLHIYNRLPIQDVRGRLFDWWEDRTSLKVVWRCVKMDNGRQSVMMNGMTRKQELCVDNWDLLKIQEVSYYILVNKALVLNTSIH